MGKRITNSFVDSSHSEIPRFFDPSCRLWNNAGGKLLSVVNHSDHRNIQSPKTATQERQQCSLERLIVPVNAEFAAALASALIIEFGSIGRVLTQSKESLSRIIGDEEIIIELLLATRAALNDMLHSQLPKRLVSSTDQPLIDYLVLTMGSQTFEEMRILFLDRINQIVADEILCTGSVHSMTVYPRTIFKRAFELSASAILIVHNHPGGSVEPSELDISFTKTIIMLGKSMEVTIKDHIVIAGSKWYSFLRQGLI
jgi:DNA repair protein RadC